MCQQAREIRIEFTQACQMMIVMAAMDRLDLGQFTSSRFDSVYKEQFLLRCADIAGIALSAAILGREYLAARVAPAATAANTGTTT